MVKAMVNSVDGDPIPVEATGDKRTHRKRA